MPLLLNSPFVDNFRASPLNGASRSPSMGDYFRQRQWESGATPAGQNRMDWANMPMTNDMLNAATSYEQSKIAHDKLMRARYLQAQDGINTLQSATDDDLRLLFSNPETAEQAALQKIIQGDANARERGAQMIPGPRQKLQYAQLWTDFQNDQARLKALNQDLTLTPQKFQLQKDEFANQKAFQALQHQHQLAQEAHQLTQEDQAAERLDPDSDFNRWIQSREDARQDRLYQRQDTQAAQQAFSNVQRAVRAGELTADEAINSFPGFSAPQQAALRGHESAARQESDQAALMAQLFNQHLKEGLPQAIPAKPSNWLGFGGAPASEPTADEIAAARNRVIAQAQKDVVARKQIALNPETGQFEPLKKYSAGVEALFAPPWDNSVFDARGATPDGPQPPVTLLFRQGNKTPNFAAPIGEMDYSGGSNLNQPRQSGSGGLDGIPIEDWIPTEKEDGLYQASDGTRFIVRKGRRYLYTPPKFSPR